MRPPLSKKLTTARRHRKLPPMPLPEYKTLDEVKKAGVPVSPDMLVPEDRQRIAVQSMGALDDLHESIRVAIKEALWDPLINMQTDDGRVVRVNYVGLAVNLIDKGAQPAQIVRKIKEIDILVTADQRQSGILPPKGRAS